MDNRTISQLSSAVARHIGETSVTLTRNPVQGFASETFRGVTGGGQKIFVKVNRKDARLLECALNAHERCRGLPFIPAVLGGGLLDFDGVGVLVTECLTGTSVGEYEKLTDGQVLGLVKSYVAFSERIQSTPATELWPRNSLEPEGNYSLLQSYCRRNAIARRLLKDLQGVPLEDCSFLGRKVGVIHNDFAKNNFAIGADNLAAIYDIGSCAPGLPCEDLLFGLSIRYRAASLSSAGRRRIREILARMAEVAPWERGDWCLAINMQRVEFAARMAAADPRSWRMAWKICRRDARHRELLGCFQ